MSTLAAEKPVVSEPTKATETPAVPAATTEPTTTATTEPAAHATTAEPTTTEPTIEAAKPTETTTAAAPTTAAETTEPKVADKKVVEPIYTGALGYKAPGLIKSFVFSKKYFWFGEEEPVHHDKLSSYLRGEKPEVAHHTAAWSSKTGKGLLYFAKHADSKSSPAGVLNLSEASDLTKEGTVDFSFKLHGHKHTFQASTPTERDGWYVAIEKAIEEAKAGKEGVTSSPEYKDAMGKLSGPSLAVAGASTTPKKSTEVTKPADKSLDATTDKKVAEERNKSKSRSVSRGKRGSIFGSLMGKKEEVEEKMAEKKEEKKEAKEEKKAEEHAKKEHEPTTTGAVAPAAAATTAAATTAPHSHTEAPREAPLDAQAIAARAVGEPVAETKAVDTPAVAPTTGATTASTTAETKAAETTEKPKPTKRGSIFGDLFQKVKSPTTEKKEHEVAPTVPPKDTTAPTTTAATTAPDVNGTKETPAEKAAETIAPKEAAVAPKETTAPTTTAPAATDNKENRRKSLFGDLSGSMKKDKKPEEKTSNKLGGLFRNPSKALKGGNKEKDVKKDTVATTPAKVDEAVEPTESKAPRIEEPTESKLEEPKSTTNATTDGPISEGAIGDVTPNAVSVGQAPSSTPAVHAAA